MTNLRVSMSEEPISLTVSGSLVGYQSIRPITFLWPIDYDDLEQPHVYFRIFPRNPDCSNIIY